MKNCVNRIAGISVLGCLVLLMQNSYAYVGTMTTPGIWLNREKSYRLSKAHEEELVRSLRRITGLHGLRFTEDGALSLGDNALAKSGSSLARQILWCARGSGNVFIIEDHSGSSSVNFGQMDEGTRYENAKSQQRAEIWRIRLDFDDFREIVAPREVRAAFDVGFTMLHELLHGFGYRDADYENEIGECEELINQSRIELGLPLRDQYFGEAIPMSPFHTSVRLRFSSEGSKPARQGESEFRRRLHYLFFLLPLGPGPLQSEERMSMFNCNAGKR